MDIWCCGDHRVWRINPADRDVAGVCPILEEIDFQTIAGISPEQRSWFLRTDEVKPLAHDARAEATRELLVSSSSNGVAVIRRNEDGTWRARWTFHVDNAHSVAAIGEGFFAIAGSVGTDQLVLAHEINQQIREMARLRLVHAHGVLWDRQRGCVWAIGGNVLLKLAVPLYTPDTTAAWEVLGKYALSEAGAHDLSPLPDGGLAISTNRSVWRFDPEQERMEGLEDLGQLDEVKSIVIDPSAGRLLTRADDGVWWTREIHWRPAGAKENIVLRVGDDRIIYKVRWDTPW